MACVGARKQLRTSDASLRAPPCQHVSEHMTQSYIPYRTNVSRRHVIRTHPLLCRATLNLISHIPFPTTKRGQHLLAHFMSTRSAEGTSMLVSTHHPDRIWKRLDLLRSKDIDAPVRLEVSPRGTGHRSAIPTYSIYLYRLSPCCHTVSYAGFLVSHPAFSYVQPP